MIRTTVGPSARYGELEDEYDPENLFLVNQNIEPTP